FTKLITEIIKKHHKFQAYTSAISDSHCFIRSSQHPATWINLCLVESIWDTSHHDIAFKFKGLSGYVTFLNQKTSFRTSLKVTAHHMYTVVMLHHLLKEAFAFLDSEEDSKEMGKVLVECRKYLVNKFCYFSRI